MIRKISIINKIIVVLLIILILVLVLCSCDRTNHINNIHSKNQISQEFENKLNEYAKVLICVGINVKPGDKVYIECPVDDRYFGRKCVSEAYNAGAANVEVNWIDQETNHERYLKASDDSLRNVPEYVNSLKNGSAKDGASILSLLYVNPSVNEDIDSNKISAYQSSKNKTLKEYLALANNNKIPWCAAAIPQEEWAHKLFPDKSSDEAVSKLWDLIFEDARVKGDGSAIDSWNNHFNNLSNWKNKMNEYNFKSLHYTNSLGTDIDIELPINHLWTTASEEKTPNGHMFCPNIPTEEIYTAPKRSGVNGTVYSSKPLALGNTLVEGIRFELKDGKIISANADKGEDALKQYINTDEGASYFGEVALVPYDSIISKQNIIYYQTLFDENAACHIAFGYSFPYCLKNGVNMSKEQLLEAGMNQSETHIDFMVGTNDLKIVGKTQDGREITVFENGNYAFN